ncbi:TPA: MT-A70 family methyltransferase [Enterobacter asburiae]
MKRTPFYRRPGRTGQFSGLRERVIWMIQTRGRPVTGSEIAEKFGVTLIEFNRVANGITRGAGLERQHAGIKQVVYSPLGAHSEKPWEVRHRLELLYGDVPRIELFSRCGAPGWDHWGNQCPTSAVQLLPGCAIDVIKTEAA